MKRSAYILATFLAAAYLGNPTPVHPRAAPRSGVMECRGVIEQSKYSNPGFYEISNSGEPCNIDGHTDAGKKVLAVCHEGDMCKLKASGMWAPDFYVKRLISVEKLSGRQ